MIGRDLRVAWAIAVLDLRRWLTMSSARFRRADPSRRQMPTRGSMNLWLLLLAPALLSQSALLAITFLAATERAVDHRMVVGMHSYLAMHSRNVPDAPPTSREKQEVRKSLEQDPWLQALPHAERTAKVAHALEIYQATGQAGFAVREPIPYILTCPPPPGPEARVAVGKALAIGVGALLLAVVCLRIGLGNRDLGRADDPRAWLRTLPASDRSLALARWISGLIDPIAWLMLGPVMVAITLRHGDHAALWPGLLQAALLVVTASATAVAIEELVRRHLGTTGRRWVQAIGTLVGMATPVALFAGGAMPALAGILFGAASWLPAWAVLPVVPTAGGAPWVGPLAALVLATAAGGAALLMARAGRADLVGVLGGRRAAPVPAIWTPLSTLAKDLLLIRRDPELLLSIILLPALLVAFNLILNLNAIGAAMSDPRHLAVIALLAGGYAANMAAFRIVPADRPHLWLLWTAPVAPGRILAVKSLVIATVAGAFCLLGLVVGTICRPDPAWGWLAPYALIAVGIHAAFATGIVALALEPGETKRPMQRSQLSSLGGLVILGLLVSGIYAGWWAACVALALVAAGAVALWQRAGDRLRWLMDPGASPPPRLDALIGIGAAIGFVALQVPAALLAGALRLSTSASVLVAFCSAGLLASAGALLTLRSAGLHGIPRICGILPADGSRPTALRVLGQVGLGALVGTIGAVWAAGWVALAGWLGLDVPDAGPAIDSRVMLILAVGAAPLIEELLFRGLLCGGLAASLRPRWAIVGSALVFAAMHPPMGFPAVAMMGLACAVLYHQTRWLVAPIACHATYNLLVTLLGR